ncbi:hypothetical protein HJC99_03030 [Candidatus Saccharibacteria bacterium]|nr:hypothetical protein [Candidatus Saccharibacteria bacterium]
MDMFHQFNPSELVVDSRRHGSLLVGLDGEVERMKLPLTVRLERRQLLLIDAVKN